MCLYTLFSLFICILVVLISFPSTSSCDNSFFFYSYYLKPTWNVANKKFIIVWRIMNNHETIIKKLHYSMCPYILTNCIQLVLCENFFLFSMCFIFIGFSYKILHRQPTVEITAEIIFYSCQRAFIFFSYLIFLFHCAQLNTCIIIAFNFYRIQLYFSPVFSHFF